MATTYRTEPLKTYDKAKEIRSQHFRDVFTAKEQGKILTVGDLHGPKEIVAAFGEVVHIGGEPWAVFITREGQETGLPLQALEAAESHGYARDLCGMTRMFWGAMFLDKSPWGMPFPRPDFSIGTNSCDYKGKWHQVTAEYLGIPRFVWEIGPHHSFGGTLKVSEQCIQYGVAQLEEFIAWLEKQLGRKCDDEKLVESLANYYRSRCYWGEVCQLEAHVPVPLEYKLLLPFFLLMEYQPYKKETVDTLAELKDEVKYRISRGITPLPEERARVTHEGLPPWYALHLFRYLRRHGVAVVGGSNHFMFIAPVQKRRDDFLFHPMDPVEWDGIPKTREQALRFRTLCEYYSEVRRINHGVAVMMMLEAARAWRVDGIIMEQDRGCINWCVGQIELRNAIQKAGIPCMHYEANRVDHREWSWPHVSDALDAFMEALGVPRVEE
ncbi:MAG: 2-hydroxyacyl-CoA dehydratase subunit D [Dehalococcoidia bacterium]